MANSTATDPQRLFVLHKAFPYTAKRDVVGELVCVIDSQARDRALDLVGFTSRAVQAGEVHELILTDQPDAGPLAKVAQVAYLGFVAIGSSGVILVGDEVSFDGVVVGYVAGFDLTHLPNHLNVVVRTGERLRTGQEMGLALGARARFAFVGNPARAADA